jgi:hypothetical protein
MNGLATTQEHNGATHSAVADPSTVEHCFITRGEVRLNEVIEALFKRAGVECQCGDGHADEAWAYFFTPGNAYWQFRAIADQDLPLDAWGPVRSFDADSETGFVELLRLLGYGTLDVFNTTPPEPEVREVIPHDYGPITEFSELGDDFRAQAAFARKAKNAAEEGTDNEQALAVASVVWERAADLVDAAYIEADNAADDRREQS